MKCVIYLSNLRANISILNQIFIKKIDKCKHIYLTIQNPNIRNIDIIFYYYNIEHNKKFENYLVKCEFNLVFNDYD